MISSPNALTVVGTGAPGATGTSNHGATVVLGSSIGATGPGTVSILGIGGGGTAPNFGIAIVDTGSRIGSTSGRIEVNADVTDGASQALVVGAGISLGSSSGDIDITTRSIQIQSPIASIGNLSIRSSIPSDSIGLAGAPVGSLSLATAELDLLADGFASITIGDPTNGAGTTTVAPYTFRDPTVLANGAVTVSNVSAGPNPLSLIALSGLVRDASTGIDITGSPVTLAGFISPGPDFPDASGVMQIAGDLSLADNATYQPAIGGTAPGEAATSYEQLVVVGAVTLGTNVTFQPDSSAGFVPTGGDAFTIIDNDGADAISGTFNGLPEGGTISDFLGSGLEARVTYAGGDGNDVVLEVATPTIDFAQASYSGAEGDISVVLTRDITTGGDSTVRITPANGTAFANADFAPAPIDVTFTSGSASETVVIPIISDNVVELDESFTLSLSPVATAAIGPQSSATLAIINDDSALVSVQDATVMEGDSGETIVNLTLALSAPVDDAVSLDLVPSDGTATAADGDITIFNFPAVLAPFSTAPDSSHFRHHRRRRESRTRRAVLCIGSDLRRPRSGRPIRRQPRHRNHHQR